MGGRLTAAFLAAAAIMPAPALAERVAVFDL
jgi:hypothetical protein